MKGGGSDSFHATLSDMAKPAQVTLKGSYNPECNCSAPTLLKVSGAFTVYAKPNFWFLIAKIIYSNQFGEIY